MDIVNIWNDVSSNIGFYTKETAYSIPTSPGIYAWFIPLWMYNNDVYDLVELVQGAMLYDSDSRQRDSQYQGESERAGEIDFNWDLIEVKLKKRFKLKNLPDLKQFKKLSQDIEARDSLFESLMKASIFTKPLYIGRADNLSARYVQHVDGVVDKNIFHTRFKEFMEQSNVKLDVDDLLFACIPITQNSNDILKERNLTTMLESILMNIVHPPFSCK